MLGKILLTVLVVVIAALVLRQRSLNSATTRRGAAVSPGKSNTAKSAKTPATKSAQRDEFSQDMRLAAYLFLFIMVGVGAALYYWDWRDDHQILTVRLLRDSATEPVTYQVYKYQLDERSFVTIEGTRVTVAGSERMEIEGLED